MAVAAEALVGQDKQLLTDVLNIAQGDPERVLDAVRDVLTKVPRVRHSYLSHMLIACAHEKLRKKSRKKPRIVVTRQTEQCSVFDDDPDIIEGARLHEAEITYGLSSDD